MLWSNLTAVFRVFFKQKTTTLISLSSLIVGLTGAMLLYFFILEESSYDQFYPEADRIYRVFSYPGEDTREPERSAATGRAVGEALATFPEVAFAARIRRGISKRSIRTPKKKLLISGVTFASADFFRVFSRPFLAGDPRDCLRKPNSIVLSEELARKLFGDPQRGYGATVTMFEEQSLQVTGIYADLPANTHLYYPALISETTRDEEEEEVETWIDGTHYTYLKLRQKNELAVLKDKIQTLIPAFPGHDSRLLGLQPLSRAHLEADMQDDTPNQGDQDQLYYFMAIAGFLLLIAAANYINLATARSFEAAKEVGVRKILGASRFQLISRFMLETLILTLMALLISLSLLELLIPRLEAFLGQPLKFYSWSHPAFWGILTLLLVVMTLFSGLYPALVLSSFPPARILRGKWSRQGGGQRIRTLLVIAQFTISLILMTITGIMIRQMQYVQARPLGFQQEQILVASIYHPEMLERLGAFKAALKQNPRILEVGTSSTVPASQDKVRNRLEINREGSWEEILVDFYRVDQEYRQAMGITLREGKDFGGKGARPDQFLVNETLVKQLGGQKILGSKIRRPGPPGEAPEFSGEIVGVMADFHLNALHQKIAPMVIRYAPKGGTELMIRLHAEAGPETLEYLNQVWQKFDPNHPFEYLFLEQNYQARYRHDRQQQMVFEWFAGLTVLLALVGLFGLAYFTVYQKMKEIGVRKVLGASRWDIFSRISRGFLLMVGLASLLAYPLAYFFARHWLDKFAYRIGMPGEIFVGSLLLTMALVLLVLGLKTYRIVGLNPVEILKEE